MKVKVVGYAHLKGVSRKTQQPYDFVSLSVTYQPRESYHGEKVMELTTNVKYVDALAQQKIPFECNIHRQYSCREVIIEEFERG